MIAAIPTALSFDIQRFASLEEDPNRSQYTPNSWAFESIWLLQDNSSCPERNSGCTLNEEGHCGGEGSLGCPLDGWALRCRYVGPPAHQGWWSVSIDRSLPAGLVPERNKQRLDEAQFATCRIGQEGR